MCDSFQCQLYVLPQFSTVITLTDHHYKDDDVWDDGDDSNKCNDNDNNVDVARSDVFANIVKYLDIFKAFYLNNS